MARSLAQELGLDATFIRSDLDALPDVLNEEFDIVYTSRGVLGWLPDIEGWARLAARFVRPGAILYITEAHPVMWVFDDDEGVTDLRLRYPYWARDEPLEFPTRGSYADPTAHVEQAVEYNWPHGLGEVVTAIAQAGLRVEFLHEFPFVEWPVPYLEERADGTWRLPEGRYGDGELPLFFSLRATKPIGSVGVGEPPNRAQREGERSGTPVHPSTPLHPREE